jgi:hypothetical protein
MNEQFVNLVCENLAEDRFCKVDWVQTPTFTWFLFRDDDGEIMYGKSINNTWFSGGAARAGYALMLLQNSLNVPFSEIPPDITGQGASAPGGMNSA